jgi:ribosomal protein S18 acetylase RimI-like enzyme
MNTDSRLSVQRVVDQTGRQNVIEVLRATYLREKRWVTDPEAQIPPEDLEDNSISWFVVNRRGRPAGVLRVRYDPPVAAYAKYGFKLLDPKLPVESFLRDHRIAEIGRFAVIPRYRRRFMVAAALIRAACAETVERGYTHFITDVFEDEAHSPYGFHTRVMGFHPVATHDVGELNCRNRRITMVLDLKAAYQRLKRRGNWIYRYLTGHWDDALHRRLAV